MKITIQGEPCSKANSRRAVTVGGKGRFIKSKKALSYVNSAKWQLQQMVILGHLPKAPIEGDVTVTIDIWYASRRPDLDESVILDVLQGFAYLNDRQIKAKHVFWHLDREMPRARISVEPMEMEA